MPPLCSAHSDLRRVQDCRDTVLGGDCSRWLSQTPRLSSVQHQTARGEMTDDGENAELRTAEAGGGAGAGAGAGGRPASRDLLRRGVPPVPVYHWSWSRHGRCSELESRYKIRSRGRAGRESSAAACVCFKPCPRHTTVSYCPATVYGPLVLSSSSCVVLQNTLFDGRFG